MIAARAVLGISATAGVRKVTASSSKPTVMSAASWVRAPAEKLTMVRPSPPATGMAEKSAATELANPRAISS